jgi:hypothetical protein
MGRQLRRQTCALEVLLEHTLDSAADDRLAEFIAED